MGKTVFASGHVVFQFILVLFGLETAPGTFQHAMSTLLSLPRKTFTLDISGWYHGIYEDLIGAYGTHEALLDSTWRCKRYYLIEGAELFSSNISYLGHVTNHEHLAVLQHTADAIPFFKPSMNIRAPRSLLVWGPYFKSLNPTSPRLRRRLLGNCKKINGLALRRRVKTILMLKENLKQADHYDFVGSATNRRHLLVGHRRMS